MKRLLFLVASILVCAIALRAQIKGLSSTTCPGNGCVILELNGTGSVGVQITGTFVGTLQFEMSADRQTWASWYTRAQSDTSTTVTSTTTTGYWVGNTNGAAQVRVRFSAFTSGAALVAFARTASSNSAFISGPVGTAYELPTGGFPTTSMPELIFKNTLHGSGTIGVRNLSISGYSAYTSRGYDGREYFAWGYGNPNVGPPLFKDTNYIESWSGYETGGTPKRLIIAVDGDYGAIGSGIRFYQRQSFEPDGSMKWWQHIPSGMTQVESMYLDKNGGLGLGGIVSPQTMLHLQTQNGLQAATAMDSYGSALPALIGRHALGTVASPTQTTSLTTLLSLAAYGYQATGGFATTISAGINFVATEDQTSTAHGGRIDMRTAAAGTTTITTPLSISSTGVTFSTGALTPAATGTRFVCIDTNGKLVSQTTACSGT